MKKSALILSVLFIALFLRVYRTADFLGFWFDQGRDGLVIWNLIHNHKLFLIGPTTGIEGIFLGPFYYYLIAPAYWLGQGNPVFPAVFVALLTTGAVFILYKIGREYFSPAVGLTAAFLYALSQQIIYYNRWLSNPAPLPFFAAGAIWSLLRIVNRQATDRHWLLLGLLIGLSLQLEAASAIFFLPAVLITLLVTQGKRLISLKPQLLHLVFALVLTLLPQIIFNFKHQNILLNSFQRFLVYEHSFQTVFTNFYQSRLDFYLGALSSKFYPIQSTHIPFILATLLMLVLSWKYLPKKTLVGLLVWIFTPLVILLFYHGNRGYVWDYYFTGLYPALFLLVAAIWVYAWKNVRITRGIVVLLVGAFLFQNIRAYYYFYRQPLPGYISLTPMIQAADWVYQDAGDTPFNVDVYVPPVIPYSYDYVFLWRGSTKYKRVPDSQLHPRLYTLAEPDGEHPQFRDAWFRRQAGIGKVEASTTFGPILIERRLRIP